MSEVIQSLRQENFVSREKILQVEFSNHWLTNTPNIFPATGHISSTFGVRKDPFTKKPKFHQGIDIAASYGSPVWATANGQVIKAKYDASFGNLIEIEHNTGFKTRFGHLNKILVKPGDQVMRGQIIGYVGKSGRRCLGTHLHYEVQENNINVDPIQFFKLEGHTEVHHQASMPAVHLRTQGTI